MIVESIICDGCGKELIEDSPYPHSFKLELRVIDTQRSTSDIKYCVAQFPPFEGVRNFCNSECLVKWINNGNK